MELSHQHRLQSSINTDERISSHKTGKSPSHTIQFQGKAKSPVVSKAGTIPGARNIPQNLFYDPATARFASSENIDELTRRLGFVSSGERFVTFCNTGHWASLAWFALHEIQGQKNVRLYDGSMTEWTRNEGNPVQTNAE